MCLQAEELAVAALVPREPSQAVLHEAPVASQKVVHSPPLQPAASPPLTPPRHGADDDGAHCTQVDVYATLADDEVSPIEVRGGETHKAVPVTLSPLEAEGTISVLGDLGSFVHDVDFSAFKVALSLPPFPSPLL